MLMNLIKGIYCSFEYYLYMEIQKEISANLDTSTSFENRSYFTVNIKHTYRLLNPHQCFLSEQSIVKTLEGEA